MIVEELRRDAVDQHPAGVFAALIDSGVCLVGEAVEHHASNLEWEPVEHLGQFRNASCRVNNDDFGPFLQDPLRDLLLIKASRMNEKRRNAILGRQVALEAEKSAGPLPTGTLIGIRAHRQSDPSITFAPAHPKGHANSVQVIVNDTMNGGARHAIPAGGDGKLGPVQRKMSDGVFQWANDNTRDTAGQQEILQLFPFEPGRIENTDSIPEFPSPLLGSVIGTFRQWPDWSGTKKSQIGPVKLGTFGAKLLKKDRRDNVRYIPKFLSLLSHPFPGCCAYLRASPQGEGNGGLTQFQAFGQLANRQDTTNLGTGGAISGHAPSLAAG